MKNIDLKLALIQSLGIIFLIEGIERLYMFSQSEKYECVLAYLKDQNSDCWKKFESPYETMGDFMVSGFVFGFYGLIIGIILIALINWRNKTSIYNSLLTFILIMIPFACGVFRKGFINDLFNSFGGLFSRDFTVENFIGGSTFTIIAIIILWKSRKNS
ncbi:MULTISPECIES: hypothetical protein [Flavobacterium]|uniref:hypothetical protein n=1 Tax=Flavobacterium TaxID=237 RepID=UPI001FCB7BDE|nr:MULTISPECIES: hypothetical protein [Flavobacterium]UOK42149.1 hypothetical protein LZF87_12625 [Flavobacterium enshiense]